MPTKRISYLFSNVTYLGKRPLNVAATTRNLEQRQHCVYLLLSALPLFTCMGRTGNVMQCAIAVIL